MKISIFVPLVFGIFTKVSATPLVDGVNTKICEGAETLATTWIGEAKNVLIKSFFCPNSYQHRVAPPPTKDVCGAACSTTCFSPAGSGPDPNDCHVIADALRFDSENIDDQFNINQGLNVVMKYKSCETFFQNQAALGALIYCRNDWASLIDFIAPNCQAKQNASGGKCFSNDVSSAWFVQVQHV